MRLAMALGNRLISPERTNLFSECDGVPDKDSLR